MPHLGLEPSNLPIYWEFDLNAVFLYYSYITRVDMGIDSNTMRYPGIDEPRERSHSKADLIHKEVILILS